jgi:hypothetical protein
VSPNPADFGQSVTFTGTGSDSDGTVVAYEWASNLNGVIGNQASFSTSSLSSGTHSISFRVQDDLGQWSFDDTETLTIHPPPSPHQIVIDNGEPGTSFTGSWTVSGSTGQFGANSLYAKNGPTYTYTFTLPSPGMYEVYAWWTSLSSRATSVPYDIQHAGGTTTVTKDQRVNGGQFNLLGTFSFGTSATITIRALGTSSTSADAMCLLQLGPPNNAPVATIDSITPNPADMGEAVSFAGSGTDTEGPITGHEWTSNIDGLLSNQASFSTSTLSAGNHTISFRVRDNQNVWSAPDTETLNVGATGGTIIIDNGEPGTSFTGSWSVSGSPNPFGTNSLFAKNGPTYTYTFAVTPGFYEVQAWWTTASGRSPNAPFDIQHLGGTTTVTRDQRVNGGQWNVLGTFEFGATAVITIRAVGTTSTCADAMALVAQGGPPPPAEIIVDNGGPGTSFTGSWTVSGAPNPFGPNSIYAKNGPTYTFTIPASGTFRVHAWWTQLSSRPSAAPYDITHSGGTTTVNVDQRVNGGQFNLLGQFTFTSQAIITIRAVGTASTGVDAIRLEPVP